jgi:hypothetical protein
MGSRCHYFSIRRKKTKKGDYHFKSLSFPAFFAETDAAKRGKPVATVSKLILHGLCAHPRINLFRLISFPLSLAGCRVARFLLVQTYQNGKNIPNDHKLYQTTINYLYQMVINYSKWSQNLQTFFILRPSKIYPNWDFWLENKPSGNPGRLPSLT